MKTSPPRTLHRLLAGAGGLFAAAAFTAGGAFIQNPSFESNWNPTWPHYLQDVGGIDGWVSTGGYGVNDHSLDPGGPFHDNGLTPDRNRVAFHQQAGEFSQFIYGLTPGNTYWVQFYYNARGDGSASSVIHLTTRFNGVDLDTISTIRPVNNVNAFTSPFYVRTVPFVADVDSGTLAFVWSNEGDATGLLDAVTVVERGAGDVVLINPSFEASGMLPDVGPLTSIAGWVGVGTVGVDAAGGAYANDGMVPDQDLVAFIQGAGSLTQGVRHLVANTSYELTFAYNAGAGTAPHLRVLAGTTVLWESDVAPVGADVFATKSVTFTPTADHFDLIFEQTKEGTDVLLLDNVRLLGQTAVALPPMAIAPAKAELAPGQVLAISVTVPSEKLALGPADISLESTTPAVVALAGADTNGVLTLHFEKDGATVQTANAVAIRRGNASVRVTESAGLEVPNQVLIGVIESFVRNPSFDAEPAPAGLGVGPILSWTGTGTTGANRIDQPFAANSGPIPDRFQVAFIQGIGSLSQAIAGLTPNATYALQFRYSLRDNPDPAGPAIDLSVKLGGQPLVTIPDVIPLSQAGLAAYYFTNVFFTPTNASGALEFATSNPKGDATLLLDAINIVRWDPSNILLQNPSFEASGSMALYNDGLTSGWETGAAGRGTDSDGPFADSGLIPDQDQAGFLQGANYFQQVVSGLAGGSTYTLVYSINARGCCGDPPILTHYLVQAGAPGAAPTVFEEDIGPVGAGRPYLRRAIVFVADGPDQVIRIEHVPAGDKTLLVDNIRLLAGDLGPAPTLVFAAQPDGSLKISWPDAASGYLLQSAPDLNGGWTQDPALVTPQAGANVAIIQPGAAQRFYRLSL